LDWYASFFGVTTDYLLSWDKPDAEVGDRLRLTREQVGFSLAEGAALLGISEYSLDAIEAGEMEMPLSLLRKAVEGYQVDYKFILGLEGQLDDIAKLYQDIKFILLSQEIYRRKELVGIYSLLRSISEEDVGRISRFTACLVS
jgi:transcriptional regulator with XRE-family HTH domain